jgi:hypothetical protein
MGVGWDLKHFLSVMATHQYGNPDHRPSVTVPALFTLRTFFPESGILPNTSPFIVTQN